MHEDIVNLFMWYENPVSTLGKEIALSEEFVKYHRLDTIYLSYCSENGIHERISQELVGKQEEAAAKYSIYQNISIDLTERLQDENIPHVFLKGIALADDLYIEPWHRYFSDLDLLVDKEHLSAVENVLKKMGYRYGHYSRRRNEFYYPSRAEILFQKAYTHEMYNMCRKELGNIISNIDVNFLFMWKGVFNENKTYSVSDLSNHIVQRSRIPVFDNVVNMIHLCCHLYNEANFFILDRNFRGGDPKEILLIRVFDIGLLTKRLSNEELNSLVSLAQQMNCIEKVAYAVGLVNLLLKLNIGYGLDALSIDSETIYSGYFGKDQQYHTWPISLYDRIFDLQKKEEVSNVLFPPHDT